MAATVPDAGSLAQQPLGVGVEQVRAKAPSGLGLDGPGLEHVETHVAVHRDELVGARPEDVAVSGLHRHAEQVLHERDVETGALEVRMRRARAALDEAGVPEPLRYLVAAERHILAAGRIAVDEDGAHVADDPPAEATREMAGVGVERRAQVGGRHAVEVAFGLVGVQAQGEDLVVIGVGRRVVVGDRPLDAPDGEAAEAQRGRRQLRVSGQQIARQRVEQVARRVDPGDADLEAAVAVVAPHRRQPRTTALMRDRRQVQLEVELGARGQRGVGERRPQRHAAGADLQDPEMQGLPEEPRARRGREGRQRLRARIAGALTAVDIGDCRGVAARARGRSAAASRGRSAGCPRGGPRPAGRCPRPRARCSGR